MRDHGLGYARFGVTDVIKGYIPDIVLGTAVIAAIGEAMISGDKHPVALGAPAVNMMAKRAVDDGGGALILPGTARLPELI